MAKVSEELYHTGLSQLIHQVDAVIIILIKQTFHSLHLTSDGTGFRPTGQVHTLNHVKE